MPTMGGGYGAGRENVAEVLKRRPATQRSYVNAGMGMNRERTGRKDAGGGKFAGLPGGPSGGTMGKGGKRKMGRRYS